MNFKRITHWFLLSSLLMFLFSCSDEATETQLVNLHTTAAEDVIAIEFPATTETVVQIKSLTALSVQGLKSNGIDSVSLSSQIDWSLSDGATSTIDKNGRLTAGPTAETITVTATLGILSTSIDIRISAAKFNQVVKLNPDDKLPINIEMCQSQTITPFGEYIDDSGTVEIRKVDNTVINKISWIISPPQSAYIKTADNTTTLYSLAAGDLIIQAKATSDYSGNEVTSDLNQTIGNGLSSIKICSGSATDYANCSMTSTSVEQDKEVSFIAIGQYTSGSYQNISRTSKWGISDDNMSAVLSNDFQQINVTGLKESTNSTLSLACGDINQTIGDDIDITQSIILNSAIDCSADTDCKASSVDITIKKLTAKFSEVTANENKLSDSDTYQISPQPDEIVLKVSVIQSNSSEPVDITDNKNLTYEIKSGDTVVEQKTNTPGTYTVLTTGTVKILLTYLGESFLVDIEILETP